MPAQRRIVLFMGTRHGYAREIVRGFSRFLQEAPGWQVRRIEPFPFLCETAPRRRILDKLGQWRPHGILGHVVDRTAYRRLEQMDAPLVHLIERNGDATTPSVVIDWEEVGRTAADFFWDRGFRNYSFLGRFLQCDTLTAAGFTNTLAKRGAECREVTINPATLQGEPVDWSDRASRLSRAIKAQTRPCALFAGWDFLASCASDLCLRAGLRVPEDVAILGAGNDDVVTGISNPPLSSIHIPYELMGFEAGRLLCRLLSRPHTKERHLVLKPTGIAQRHSTDVFVHDDPVVCESLEYISQKAHKGMKVDALAEHLNVSRSWLEKRLRQAVGHTPLELIVRARIELAERLLRGGDASIQQVAEQSGFASHARFCKVFREQTGESPSAFRRRTRPPKR